MNGLSQVVWREWASCKFHDHDHSSYFPIIGVSDSSNTVARP